jgi:hypothetical protein
MSVAPCPELKPVALAVKLGTSKEHRPAPISEGLRDLYRTGDFADVVLLCAEQRFLAHRLVLASQSYVFKYGLSQPVPRAGLRHEIRLADINNPEAVKMMLDNLYQMDSDEFAVYNPSTQEINRDVLRLAKQFELPGLMHKAVHWLSRDLTTGNVVERLAICDEFDLAEIKEKVLDTLTNNKEALAEVVQSPQIMGYPKLMQRMLQCAASSVGCSPASQQPRGKRARKG